jgi:AcrR family transcriptional regulator
MSDATEIEGTAWPSAVDRQRLRALKREAVLKAAVKLFNEKGFRATSLDDVASDLRVTKPTIYHYFRSKDEVLFECCRIGLSMIEEAANGVATANGSGLARLRALMEKYAEIMTMDYGRSVTGTTDSELAPGSRAELRRLKSTIDRSIRSVIADGIADGSIAPCDVRTAAFMIAGALNWIARWYDPAGPLTAAEIARRSVDFLVNGLAPRQAPPSAGD